MWRTGALVRALDIGPRCPTTNFQKWSEVLFEKMGRDNPEPMHCYWIASRLNKNINHNGDHFKQTQCFGCSAVICEHSSL